MNSRPHRKMTKEEIMNAMLLGKSSHKYLDRQAHYLHNVQKELEAQQAKKAHINYYKDLSDHQNMIKYNIQIHRLKGLMSDSRFPISTKEALQHRINRLKKLGGKITD